MPRPRNEAENLQAKKEVHPGFEPGLLEGDHVVKIQSDNHYTNEPIILRLRCKFMVLPPFRCPLELDPILLLAQVTQPPALA